MRIDPRLQDVTLLYLAARRLQLRGPRVHRIPWDALGREPEPHASGIWLPEKAPSAEAWADVMRRRWPQYGQEHQP